MKATSVLFSTSQAHAPITLALRNDEALTGRPLAAHFATQHPLFVIVSAPGQSRRLRSVLGMPASPATPDVLRRRSEQRDGPRPDLSVA